MANNIQMMERGSYIDPQDLQRRQRLVEQLTYLEKNQESESTPLPWGPKIFKLNIEECL